LNDERRLPERPTATNLNLAPPTLAPHGEGDSALPILRNTLARVVWIREEFDPIVREQALEDLELDLAVELERRAA
jgi:hypothetical protein